MHERFAQGWRAAAYVAGGLVAEFPKSAFEVVFEYQGTITRKTCSAREVGHVLDEFCRGFPKATAYYEPEGGKQYVAEIHCHCSHEKKPGCCKHGRFHRAKVRVTLLAAEQVREHARQGKRQGVVAGAIPVADELVPCAWD